MEVARASQTVCNGDGVYSFHIVVGLGFMDMKALYSSWNCDPHPSPLNSLFDLLVRELE